MKIIFTFRKLEGMTFCSLLYSVLGSLALKLQSVKNVLRMSPHISSLELDDSIRSCQCYVRWTIFLPGDESSPRSHQSLSGQAPVYLANDINLVVDSGRACAYQLLPGYVSSHKQATASVT